ncbi:MAG TPA: aquaporin [Pseudomonadales bacterium]|nr:aquaporin [Pseudomonadales bacterium]HNI36749.1 aquaporin [Pseudomonadales bacterium]HNN85889.1 aquaporin [Pseudomonadales bacterium]
MKPSLKKMLLAELFGSFWIVFAGTGAIIVNDVTGAITHLGVALSFGLVVFAMISALGDISGAHFNPAVTVGFCLAKRFPLVLVIPYIASQSIGALAASSLLQYLFPSSATLGATIPSGTAVQSWILEVILMLGLMFVILSVSTGAKEKGITAGLAIGGVVALEALFAGPISGASMNPVRSFAPALLSGQIRLLWIYLTAPFVGALAAVMVCACTREAGCCSGAWGECNRE